MPLYKVERDLQEPRVVEATNPAAARQHVAKDELRVSRITAVEAMRLGGNGVLLETAGEQPEPESAAESGQASSGLTDQAPDNGEQPTEPEEPEEPDAACPHGEPDRDCHDCLEERRADDEIDPDRQREDKDELDRLVEEDERPAFERMREKAGLGEK